VFIRKRREASLYRGGAKWSKIKYQASPAMLAGSAVDL